MAPFKELVTSFRLKYQVRVRVYGIDILTSTLAYCTKMQITVLKLLGMYTLAYVIEAPLTWIVDYSTHKYMTWVEVSDSGKCSSLLHRVNLYSITKCCRTDP